ncbi:hypothetical protein MMC25_000908 [Agyrium rufum]|nr:hypothetical protein [Agyrium rufum]
MVDSRAPTTSTTVTTIRTRSESEKKQSNAATGVSAAGVRAIASRSLAFYFRAPAKAFFRTRVDYLAFARAINPRVQANEAWSWRMSTPWLLGHAVRVQGWSFIPKNVLPPLAANVGVGAVLYTSYLQVLALNHAPASESLKRVYPPPPISATFGAGFTAGMISSVLAAPFDALQVRFKASELLNGKYRDMWQYSFRKLREIGARGAYAGLTLSTVKDSLGFGVFFATFEYVKAQSFYAFVTRYYGNLQPQLLATYYQSGPEGERGVRTIRPHYSTEPAFLLLAGVSASITQQTIQYPLSHVQEIYYGRLKSLDRISKNRPTRTQTMKNYGLAYAKTFEKCSTQAQVRGSWRRWLYQGFLINTLKQVPSTSAGLVIFELVRRRYADASEAVRIEKDGYDILLT